jgi:hypothetical protein
MTRPIALGAALLALGSALLVLACSKPSPEQNQTETATGATTGSVPRVKLTDQPRLRPADGGALPRPPDPQAVSAGQKLHETVSKQCSDDKCRHEKCGPLCAQWVREQTGQGGATASGQQKRYFDCLGACMFPKPAPPKP